MVVGYTRFVEGPDERGYVVKEEVLVRLFRLASIGNGAVVEHQKGSVERADKSWVLLLLLLLLLMVCLLLVEPHCPYPLEMCRCPSRRCRGWRP